MSDQPANSNLPKLSVVIPAFNAERYLAPTLASVAKQQYPNLEVIIADGGSTDRTKYIADLYGPLVTRFISGPDKGQLDALQKGLSLATGEICFWLNADDIIMPGSFEYVGRFFRRYPDTELLFSNSWAFASEAQRLVVSSDVRWHTFWDHFLHFQQIFSEGVYWRREITEQGLPVDTSLRLCTDYAFFMELGYGRKRRWTGRRLGAFRMVPGGTQISARYMHLMPEEMNRIKARMREKLKMSTEQFERLKRRHAPVFYLRHRVWPKLESATRFSLRKLSGETVRRRVGQKLFDEWLVPPSEVVRKLPEELKQY